MRRFIVLFSAVMLISLTSCGKFKEIKVNSVKVEKVTPYGLRGVELDLVVEVDNPAAQIKLSDMEAEIEYCGKVLGRVTVDPFTMERRSIRKYNLKAKAILDQQVKLNDMLGLLDNKFMDRCLIDVKAKGKLKGGLSKTVTKNDIPLKKLVKYADKKK